MSNQLGNVLRPAIERFADKVAIDDERGCWLWIAGTNGVGYGSFYGGRTDSSDDGRTYAHRWSYEHFVGPIPAGFHLDHLCRTTACVNPDHLEPVTPRVNLLRGRGPSAVHAAKTHCPAGHPYSGDNLYIYPTKNQRRCRACGREQAQRKRDRNKAA